MKEIGHNFLDRIENLYEMMLHLASENCELSKMQAKFFVKIELNLLMLRQEQLWMVGDKITNQDKFEGFRMRKAPSNHIF